MSWENLLFGKECTVTMGHVCETRNEGSEKVSKLPKVTQLKRGGIQTVYLFDQIILETTPSLDLSLESCSLINFMISTIRREKFILGLEIFPDQSGST